MQADFGKLVPEIRDWNHGKGVDIDNWIAYEGNYKLAVGYSRIFWPEFVEIDGYVLRSGATEANLRGWEEAYPGQHTRIESVMNHIHIADIHSGDTPTEDQVLYLGRVLREIYAARLACLFPDKKFTVIFDESDGQDVPDYELTFYQTPVDGLASGPSARQRQPASAQSEAEGRP